MATQQTQGNDNPNKRAETKGGAAQGASTQSLARPSALEMAGSDGPFALMSRLVQEMDRLFYGMLPSAGARFPFQSREWRPAIDVMVKDDKLIVQADLPGLKKENLNIEVADNQLSISGERREESEREQGGYRFAERSHGRFSRTIPLPEGVKPDDVAAKFEDGVLRVEVPVPSSSQRQTRQIPIR